MTECPSDISIGDAGDISIGDLQNSGAPLRFIVVAGLVDGPSLKARTRKANALTPRTTVPISTKKYSTADERR
jgi:hypothetical protein